MIVLASTTDILTMITSSTANIDVQANYVDYNGTTQVADSFNTAVAAAQTTTIVLSPAASTQRNVRHLTIRNKHATTSNTITIQHFDAATTVEKFKCTLLAGEVIQFNDGTFTVYDAAGAAKCAGRSGRYLKTTILTSGVTFTTGPETNTIYLRMNGGGGQGGGCTIGSATISGAAGGGASGGFAEKTFAVTPNTNYTYAIGAAGTTSAAGATTGQAGGNTTFAVGGVTVTANGGPGGIGCTSAASVTTLGGAPPAASTNGDVNGSGNPGQYGFVSAVGIAASGQGGSSRFGGGGNSLKTQGTGSAAIGLGSGGGGGCAIGAVAAVAGGAGTAGIIVVDEYA